MDESIINNEPIMNNEPIPVEATIPEKPKMPSPYDRSKLKEQIKNKQTCSPLDLSKLPEECDQLLNLQPIIHRKEEIHDDEIDCGDLFGSKYKQNLFL
jgi:hypothetical protein